MVISSNLAASKRPISDKVRSMSSISISEIPYTTPISDIIQLVFWSLINVSIDKQWENCNLLGDMKKLMNYLLGDKLELPMSNNDHLV